MGRLLLLLLCAGTALALGALGLVWLGLEAWSQSTEITECRVPLTEDHECRGFDDSWTECRWAFRAEGRPEPSLCRRFISAPTRRSSGEGVRDYDDVDRFTAVPCAPWGLAESRFRCFEGVRTEHEAVNRYLLAFDRDCEDAVILRTCNLPLEEAERQ